MLSIKVDLLIQYNMSWITNNMCSWIQHNILHYSFKKNYRQNRKYHKEKKIIKSSTRVEY